MTKPPNNRTTIPGQLGVENTVHRFNGVEIPDNEDPWSAGYAAGLRASGSTFIDDDHVDPKVIVVRMLPEEYLENAIAKDQLLELSERVLELDRRVSRLERDYPPRPH
jgi:hypothetical protein